MCKTYKVTPELTAGMLVVLETGVIKLVSAESNCLGWSVWSYKLVFGECNLPYLSGSEYTKWEVILPL